MAEYYIVGTISVEVDNTSTKIKVTPATGYLSHDKKNAVFYEKNNDPALLRLIDNNTVSLDCEIHIQPQWLIDVAASQKPILLNFNDSNLKVSRFTFPSPNP